jgi:hypothetical protein
MGGVFSSSALRLSLSLKPLLPLPFDLQKSAEHHVQQMFSSSALLAMTWLIPIVGLTRDDTSHTYWLNGTPLPISVTGVLRIQKSDYAMAQIHATTAVWAPRGNNTHRALELFLRSRNPDRLQSGRLSNRPDVTALVSELDSLRRGEHVDWIDPLLALDLWHQVTPIASERATCCIKRLVAGTYDLAYDGPHGRTLADLKTLGANGRTYCVRAQLGGYMALEATHGVHYDAAHAIWAAPGRAHLGELYSRRECLLAWAAVWTQWKARFRPF